ncbi:hypothetical protein [Phenylobacterium sp.]|uniref:hypothetical protein n=1 Tax=Phenylobacterium sp. TaxID=1871053 RepID=UPI002F3F534B
MILWAAVFAGLALVVAAAAMAVAMVRAERRARRRLYQALGLGHQAIDLLMARNGDVLSELSILRNSQVTTHPAPEAALEAPAPVTEGAAAAEGSLTHSESVLAPPRAPSAPRASRPVEARPLASRRRQPYSGRHRQF